MPTYVVKTAEESKAVEMLTNYRLLLVPFITPVGSIYTAPAAPPPAPPASSGTRSSAHA